MGSIFIKYFKPKMLTITSLRNSKYNCKESRILLPNNNKPHLSERNNVSLNHANVLSIIYSQKEMIKIVGK